MRQCSHAIWDMWWYDGDQWHRDNMEWKSTCMRAHTNTHTHTLPAVFIFARTALTTSRGLHLPCLPALYQTSLDIDILGLVETK